MSYRIYQLHRDVRIKSSSPPVGVESGLTQPPSYLASSLVRGICAAFFSLIFFANISQALVYQTTEADGSVSFAYVPNSNSQPLNLNGAGVSGFSAANVQTATPMASATSGSVASVSSTTATEATAKVSELSTYSKVVISSPIDQTTFQSQDPIPVNVETQPLLQDGDKLQLIVDGKPYGQPQTESLFALAGLERGTHQIQARVINAKEAPLTVSQTVTIYKHQQSVLLQAGASPATPAAG
jgi:hypothetical protein